MTAACALVMSSSSVMSVTMPQCRTADKHLMVRLGLRLITTLRQPGDRISLIHLTRLRQAWTMIGMSEMHAQTTIPQLTLGWRLQMSLDHAGISAQQMADELGVVRSTVSRWMHDTGAPPRDGFLRVWALRTGVPYEWLRHGVVTATDPDDGGPVSAGSATRQYAPGGSVAMFTRGLAASRYASGYLRTAVAA